MHTSVTDVPLTKRGEQQARDQGAVLNGHRFDLVLCSPRTRARVTPALAGYPNPVIDDDLAEWDYGEYEGITTPQIIESRAGMSWNLWRDGVVPGATSGESAKQVQDRARRVVDRCTATLQAGRDVLLISHAHLLRMLAITWTGLPITAGAVLHMDTGTFGVLGYEHAQRAILSWNCQLHSG